jgi:hypothetical protein
MEEKRKRKNYDLNQRRKPEEKTKLQLFFLSFFFFGAIKT